MSKKGKVKSTQESTAEAESKEHNGDLVPPTIVEGSAEEVFPNQGQEQPGSHEGKTEQGTEKAVPKPRVSRRPYIADLEILLAAGTHTKKTMLEFIKEKYPSVNVGGASTFITDLLNVRYNHFKPRVVVRLADGRLQFADMATVETSVKAPDIEEPPATETTEKPGE